jgi:hypothetical protein
MSHFERSILAGLLLCSLPAWPAFAAPGGRAVETETIVVPEDEAPSAMPEIPPGAEDGLLGGEAVTPDEAEESPPDDTVATESPEVEYDLAILPSPVRRLREQIIEAAASGDPERLRPIIDANGEPPAFSFNAVGDPIAYLKSVSGDPEGREILAILIEVLEAGFVHVDVGTPNEMYVWPYFARLPVDQLTPQQLVELFKLVYAGDYEDMLAYQAYFSYRAGIAPDGTWRFFLAGD